jgi:hypothetical protein
MLDVFISADVTTGATGSIASIVGGVVNIQGASVTAAGGVISALSGGVTSVSAASITGASAVISGFGGGAVFITGASITSAGSKIQSLSGGVVNIQGESITAAKATASLAGGSELIGMTLCGVVQEVLMLWGIGCIKNAPGFAIERAITDVNAALQMIWNHASDRSYWTTETLVLSLADGETSIDLPDSIQNVTGPCRRTSNKRPLVPVGTMGELDTFSDLYLDSIPVDEPVAYHIERMAQSGNDPARCILHVTPEAQNETVALELEVVMEAPRFSPEDLNSCPLLPIPHQYVETLLVPIVRYRAAGFTMLFNRPERQEVIDREYGESRLALGLADPLPGNSGDNRPKPASAK